jgi:EmrB/QacA subfamily drug resistance transporter
MALDIAPVRVARAPRKLGLALAVIALAQLMVVLDTAVVNIALPSIQRALHFSPNNLEWVVNGYALAFGGLLLLGGRAGDLFGRRRTFIGGIVLFSLGSFAGGLAMSATWLVAARIFQGIGAAIVAPTALALVADTFPQGPARNRAFGVYSAVSGAGGAVGLLLGGLITNYFSWRWVLFINVPIGLLLIWSAPRVLIAAAPRPGRLDVIGAIAVTGGMASLVYGLNHVASSSWSDSVTLATLAAGAALLVFFIATESRTADALMPLAIFVNGTRSAAIAIRFAVGAILSALLFFLTQYLQNILGFTPIQAGLAFLPITAGVVTGAQLSSRLIARFGPRPLLMGGTVLVAGGIGWLSGITEHSGYLSGVLGAMIVFSLGLGLIFVSTTISGVAGVDRRQSGLASALLNVGQQLGASVGLAVLGTVAVNTTRNHLLLARPSHLAFVHAITTGYDAALMISALIGAGAFLLAVLFVRREKSGTTMDTVPDAA